MLTQQILVSISYNLLTPPVCMYMLILFLILISVRPHLPRLCPRSGSRGSWQRMLKLCGGEWRSLPSRSKRKWPKVPRKKDYVFFPPFLKEKWQLKKPLFPFPSPCRVIFLAFTDRHGGGSFSKEEGRGLEVVHPHVDLSDCKTCGDCRVACSTVFLLLWKWEI